MHASTFEARPTYIIESYEALSVQTQAFYGKCKIGSIKSVRKVTTEKTMYSIFFFTEFKYEYAEMTNSEYHIKYTRTHKIIW